MEGWLEDLDGAGAPEIFVASLVYDAHSALADGVLQSVGAEPVDTGASPPGPLLLPFGKLTVGRRREGELWRGRWHNIDTLHRQEGEDLLAWFCDVVHYPQ